jgi:hypothetical protein
VCVCVCVCLCYATLHTAGRKWETVSLGQCGTDFGKVEGDPPGECQPPDWFCKLPLGAWVESSLSGITALPGGGWRLLLVDYSLKRCALVPCCYTVQKSCVTLMRFLFECWKESLLIRLVVIELPNHSSLFLRRGRHKCN